MSVTDRLLSAIVVRLAALLLMSLAAHALASRVPADAGKVELAMSEGSGGAYVGGETGSQD